MVCFGGALGSGARYLVALATPRSTLLVNLIGSFCIALAISLMRPSDVRIMIVSGFLGGFTTYSAFNEETLQMLSSGAFGGAAWNVIVTVAGCLAAGYAGLTIARMLR